MTVDVGVPVLALESPFHSFPPALLLEVGTALLVMGLLVLTATQLRAVMDVPPRAAIVLAGCLGATTWYQLAANPALLESLWTLVAVTAVLVPAAATAVAIRGLLGVA